MAHANYGSSVEGSNSRDTSGEQENFWGIGLIFLGALMMMTAGSFHFIQGLAAVLNEDFFVPHQGFGMQLDVTAWGWLQMLGGTVLGIIALFLMMGSALARWAAIVAVVLSLIGSFYSVPYYPIWSVILVAFDLVILWALIVYGKKLTEY